jgi:hypothetical protein
VPHIGGKKEPGVDLGDVRRPWVHDLDLRETRVGQDLHRPFAELVGVTRNDPTAPVFVLELAVGS